MPSPGSKLSILIVDDSVVFRSAVASALEDEEDLKVVGSVRNGIKAMEFIRSQIENGEDMLKRGKQPGEAFAKLPDIITLDVEMPEMDGLTTLKEIQKLKASFSAKIPVINSKLLVIMLSAHTHKGAEITILALESGAFDFVTKPAGQNMADNLEKLRLHLLPKIRYLAIQRTKIKVEAAKFRAPIEAPKAPRARPAAKISKQAGAILIGVSTGGPNALKKLLPSLCAATDLPILIVQHMPPVFTKSLAESMDRSCGHTAIEAVGNETVENRYIYIAPGGKHMVIRRSATGQLMLGLNENEPENGCRPSVDVLFRTAASVCGGDVVTIILTGMGSDGTKGLAALKRAGAYSIVQDEATSVVWGMPGSAVQAGLADEVLPLDQIAPRVGAIIGGKA